ncbi:hypothetical protein QQ045_006148 [Rhodiola kirilowii]
MWFAWIMEHHYMMIILCLLHEKKDGTEIINEVGVIKERKAKKEAEVEEIKARLDTKLNLIGNLVPDSVPIHNDEANNTVVRTWGEKREEEGLKNHVEHVDLLGIADLIKGANVAGAGGRGFYLKGYGLVLYKNPGDALFAPSYSCPFFVGAFLLLLENRHIAAGKRSGEKWVLEQSLYTLWNLSVDEKHKAKIAGSERTPLLIKCPSTEDMRVKGSCWRGLANLALVINFTVSW